MKKTTIQEVKQLLKKMKTYMADGEIRLGRYTLIIGMEKDSAGEDGFVYSWDLFEGDENIKGDGYFYSEDDLLNSLIENDIV